MNQAFSHIASVSFKHNFFSDGLFRPISIQIDEDTGRLMKNLSIIIKPYTGGFHILCADTSLLVSEGDSDVLNINFTCQDPYYINYSDLTAFAPSSTLLYFNNLNPVSVGNELDLRLHQNEYVSGSDMIDIGSQLLLIPDYKESNDYHFKAAYSDVKLDVYKNELGQFNISSLPIGLIHVYLNDEKVYEFYHSPNVWKKPLGILRLHTNNLVKDSQEEKVNYVIHFNNRSTIWKYFIPSKPNRDFHALSIINKAKTSVFKAPIKEIVNNTEMSVIESKEMLPLCEKYKESLQLVDGYDSNLRTGNTIIQHLPVPSPDQLYTDTPPSEEIFYSHIYIHI